MLEVLISKVFMSLYRSSWYKSPTVTSESKLSSSDTTKLREAVTLHYPFKSYYSDKFIKGTSNINSVYFTFNDTQLVLKYPGYNSSSIYKYWSKTDID